MSSWAVYCGDIESVNGKVKKIDRKDGWGAVGTLVRLVSVQNVISPVGGFVIIRIFFA